MTNEMIINILRQFYDNSDKRLKKEFSLSEARKELLDNNVQLSKHELRILLHDLVKNGIIAVKGNRKHYFGFIENIKTNALDAVENFKNKIRMVREGFANAAICVGRGGIGKTYTITEILEGSNYRLVKGNVTPVEFVNLLYEENKADRILVFDDCDSVLDVSNVTMLNLLKAATDSSEKRTINYLSASSTVKCKEFEYVGKIIIVSNRKFNPENPHEKAILTRSSVCKYSLSNSEVLAIIETIIPTFKSDLSEDEKLECYNHLKSLDMPDDSVEFRLYNQLLSLYSFHKVSPSHLNYRDSFKMQLDSLKSL